MLEPSQKYMSRLFKDGRAMFLAYDQGLEHGPKDFNDKNYNPEYIIDIALRNKYTGLIFHKGLAEKYRENYSGKVPLIVKVNGKDNIAKAQADEEPYSPVVCSVDYAVKLGADAVGYTLYVGSPLEAKAMKDFAGGNPKVKLKGGYLDGKVLSAKEVEALADTPARPVLLARLCGGLASPLSRLAQALSGPQRKLVYALNSIHDQKSKQPSAG